MFHSASLPSSDKNLLILAISYGVSMTGIWKLLYLFEFFEEAYSSSA